MHGHGTGNEKKSFQPKLGLKGLMSEHAVEAEGDPEATDAVHDQKQSQIHPGNPLIPQEDDGTDDADDRQPDQGQEDKFGERRGCVGVGNGCAQVASFAYIPKGGK